MYHKQDDRREECQREEEVERGGTTVIRCDVNDGWSRKVSLSLER